MSVESTVRAVTTYRLTEMKQRGEKIAMLTSYDYSMAKIVDAAGIDVILVGDSAANVMAGYETTLPITLDMMIYHACSVVRAVNRALVVVDLPFGTYQGNSKVALDSAIRIMKETEADAVKIEGGEDVIPFTTLVVKDNLFIESHPGDSAEECFEAAEKNVRGARGADCYAFCYDGYIETDDGVKDALIAEGGVPGADEGYAIAYLYEVDDEGAYTFESEAAYIGEAPNFMAALKEPVAYTDDEIDERYRDEDDAEEAAEVAEAADLAEAAEEAVAVVDAEDATE